MIPVVHWPEGHVRCFWRYIPVHPDNAVYAQHDASLSLCHKAKSRGCSKLRVLQESTPSSTMLFTLANDRGGLQRAVTVRPFPMRTVYSTLRFAPLIFLHEHVTTYEIQ
jgi:hypothetical protein